MTFHFIFFNNLRLENGVVINGYGGHKYDLQF
jgi:hypothetical protein